MSRHLRTLLLLLFVSWAELSAKSLVDFSVTGQKLYPYSLETVCEGLGHKHNILAEREDQLRIDCMGKVVNVMKFCQNQKYKNPLLRAYIPSEQKDIETKAYCVTGTQGRLKVSCESKKTRHYCRDLDSSCGKLKKIYAHDLEVAHTAREMNGAKETLICLFGSLEGQSPSDLMSLPEEAL